MAAKWNLRNFEIFCHRGYLGTNTIDSFQQAVNRGYHVESDTVQTADGTVFMEHDRTINNVAVSSMTDAEFRAVRPNQPTADEFIAFMQANPETLACISMYAGSSVFLAKAQAGGVLDRMIFDASVPSPGSQALAMYPEASWIIYVSEGMTDKDLDAYRSHSNIVSADNSNIDFDNSSGTFPVMRNFTASKYNVAELVAQGVTWFVTSTSGSGNDEVAEILKGLTPPGYESETMMREIADAIRLQNGYSGDIPGRNFASSIRKIEKETATEGTYYSKTIQNSNYLCICPKGMTTGISSVILDMNSIAHGLPTMNYFLPDQLVSIKVLNGENASSASDVLRQSLNIERLDFVPAVKPTNMTRWGQAFYSEMASKGGPASLYPEKVTITGIDLSALTTAVPSSFFASMGAGIPLEIIFEGTLSMTGCNFTSSNQLTHDSLMSLINCLEDNSGGTQKTVTVGATNLAKLTADEIAIATAKNWAIS